MGKSVSNFFLPTLFIAIGISLILDACKKDKKVEDPIASAKNWYMENNVGNGVLLQSSKGSSQQIKEDIDWNVARTFQLNDGTNVVAVPAKMILGKAELGGSYMLLIENSSNNYQLRIAFNPKKDYFKDYLSDRGLMAIYNQTVNAAIKSPKSGKGSKLMVITCASWYLTTTYYDGGGDVISSWSRYLYTSCSGDLGDYPEPDHGGPVDCAGVLAGGAYLADCGCIGGTTGIAACPLIIRTD